ncbi:MAG: hypothetical protein M0Z39_11555 [Actinomycetota bacterium]|nr:hypothetical protein [Actinomycetota bacterium]
MLIGRLTEFGAFIYQLLLQVSTHDSWLKILGQVVLGSPKSRDHGFQASSLLGGGRNETVELHKVIAP